MNFMDWWKPIRHDQIWGDVREYRFPYLAWLWGEFRYWLKRKGRNGWM